MNLKLFYQKTVEFLALLLVFVLPFNGLISTITRYKLGWGNFWIYKDLIVITLIVINSIAFMVGYKTLRKRLSIIHLLIILFGIWTMASIIWAPDQSFFRLAVGLKYNFMFLLAFFAGSSCWLMSEAFRDRLFTWTFAGGVLAVITSLILHFGLGPENFTMFGYRPDWSTHYAGQAGAFCQKIENMDYCRLQGVFSGPNQLGAYLIILTSLLWLIPKMRFKWIWFVAFLAVGVLTFSRSAILGLIVFGALISFKNRWKVLIGSATGLGIIGFLMKDFFLRPESTFGHFTNWMLGIDAMIKAPILGLGLATAGSAANFFKNPIIPENWFLGIGAQMGIIGMFLFVVIYLGLLKKLENTSKPLAAAMIAMLAPLMLLHTFEDVTVAYTLFFLIGIVCATPSKERKVPLNW